MSLADQLNWRPATQLAGLIRSKAISPIELLRSCLETIERLNTRINAICTLAAESAMAAGQRAERAVMSGDELGLLHGVPIGIKDLTATAGIRTTFGSPHHADHVPDEDAAVVKRIKQAGAVIVGKTNTPEFGAGANTVNRLFGATRNPWDLALTVGGSSGGAAAAWPRACCRSPRAPISAAHCAFPPGFAGWLACAPRPDWLPDIPPRCHGMWAACMVRWRAMPRMRHCCSTR
jgi:amidase